MKTTTTSQSPPPVGRRVTALLATLRLELQRNVYVADRLLPSENDLAVRYGVSKNTVHRALIALEQEGLIAILPRRGCRVLRLPESATAPAFTTTSIADETPAPVAYLCEGGDNPYVWDSVIGSVLLTAVQRAAGLRGQALVTLDLRRRTAASALDELRRLNVVGVILDNSAGKATQEIVSANFPAVVLSDWVLDAHLDSVCQDDQQGAMLMVDYLASRGCKTLAWFGLNATINRHSLDRYGGFLMAAAQAGLSVPPDQIVTPAPDRIQANILQLLRRPQRPDGIVVPWLTYMPPVLAAAKEIGLVMGKDLHVVGWCVEDSLESAYLPMFQGIPVAPAVTWNPVALAEAALNRLNERARTPSMPVMRLKLPMRLIVSP